MTDVINSWKNTSVFKKQLAFNLKELSGNYPVHWIIILSLIKKYLPSSFLDVGCGCGALYEVCFKEFPNMSYYGVDYSEEAIDLAKLSWCGDSFSVKNYLSLTTDYVAKFDLIHLGALLDVLPNGDEALEHMLSIKPKSLLISRMKFTELPSFYETYKAYDEITTCAYYHNKDNFIKLCEKYGYEISDTLNNGNDTTHKHVYLNKKI